MKGLRGTERLRNGPKVPPQGATRQQMPPRAPPPRLMAPTAATTFILSPGVLSNR